MREQLSQLRLVQILLGYTLHKHRIRLGQLRMLWVHQELLPDNEPILQLNPDEV